MLAGSFASLLRRVRNSASQSPLSLVCRLYSSSTFSNVPASAKSSSSFGRRLRKAVPSAARFFTSRSASISGLARTPLSTLASRGSLRIRKTKAHRRDFKTPSALPSLRLRMVWWISRSNAPELRRLVASWSNRKSAGTTVPSGSSAVCADGFVKRCAIASAVGRPCRRCRRPAMPAPRNVGERAAAGSRPPAPPCLRCAARCGRRSGGGRSRRRRRPGRLPRRRSGRRVSPAPRGG